jgi:hypothetical protein
MFCITDNHRHSRAIAQTFKPLQCQLQQGIVIFIGDKAGDKLLGTIQPGHRPESRTRASGQNYGNYRHIYHSSFAAPFDYLWFTCHLGSAIDWLLTNSMPSAYG